MNATPEVQKPAVKQDQAVQTKTVSPKRKKKWVKRLIIIGIILVPVIFVAVTCSNMGRNLSNMVSFSDTTVLEYSDIELTISATGYVESAKSKSVYTNLKYPVKDVIVSVGDTVSNGSLLCLLDSEALEQQIKAKEISMGISKRAGNQQVKTARDNYNAAVDGKSYNLTDAQSALNSARTAKDNAYSAMTAAKKALDDAQKATSTNLADIAKLQGEYTTAVKAYESANATYNSAASKVSAADFSADNQIQQSRNALSSAQIQANTELAQFELDNLYDDLDNTELKSPVTGTVTAVYASVGVVPTGVMFVIEDTENLIIETSVKGYDIGTVKPGMQVTIKSDATGDEVFEGVIKSIAPTSAKNALGVTDKTSDAMFETEVDVLSKGSGLKIGMSVRLNYIIDSATNVLSVPYDAVYQNAQGKDCILAAFPTQNETPGSVKDQRLSGEYTLKEMVVQTGMESDLDIVVSGEGIAPGLRVLNNPEKYHAGQVIVLSNVTSGAGNSGFNMMPPMPGGGMQVRSGG